MGAILPVKLGSRRHTAINSWRGPRYVDAASSVVSSPRLRAVVQPTTTQPRTSGRLTSCTRAMPLSHAGSRDMAAFHVFSLVCSSHERLQERRHHSVRAHGMDISYSKPLSRESSSRTAARDCAHVIMSLSDDANHIGIHRRNACADIFRSATSRICFAQLGGLLVASAHDFWTEAKRHRYPRLSKHRRILSRTSSGIADRTAVHLQTSLGCCNVVSGRLPPDLLPCLRRLLPVPSAIPEADYQR